MGKWVHRTAVRKAVDLWAMELCMWQCRSPKQLGRTSVRARALAGISYGLCCLEPVAIA
jgi:hypothetical protein